jgi:hypothetical protein
MKGNASIIRVGVATSLNEDRSGYPLNGILYQLYRIKYILKDFEKSRATPRMPFWEGKQNYLVSKFTSGHESLGSVLDIVRCAKPERFHIEHEDARAVLALLFADLDALQIE